MWEKERADNEATDGLQVKTEIQGNRIIRLNDSCRCGLGRHFNISPPVYCCDIISKFSPKLWSQRGGMCLLIETRWCSQVMWGYHNVYWIAMAWDLEQKCGKTSLIRRDRFNWNSFAFYIFILFIWNILINVMRDKVMQMSSFLKSQKFLKICKEKKKRKRKWIREKNDSRSGLNWVR